jgi:hypothetical protein
MQISATMNGPSSLERPVLLFLITFLLAPNNKASSLGHPAQARCGAVVQSQRPCKAARGPFGSDHTGQISKYVSGSLAVNVLDEDAECEAIRGSGRASFLPAYPRTGVFEVMQGRQIDAAT